MPWKVLVTYPRAELVNELRAHPAVSPQELLVNVVSRDLFCCLKAVSCETRVPGRLWELGAVRWCRGRGRMLTVVLCWAVRVAADHGNARWRANAR